MMSKDEFEAYLTSMDRETLKKVWGGENMFVNSAMKGDENTLQEIYSLFCFLSYLKTDNVLARWARALVSDVFMNLEKKNIDNIRQIISIIKHSGDLFYDDRKINIYSEDFKSICRMPIYLPWSEHLILSGEYILYLLNIDVEDIYLKRKYGLKEDTSNITTESDRKAHNRDIDKEKRTLYLESRGSHYKNFEKMLKLSFKYINRGKDRDLWRILEAYAYVADDLNKSIGAEKNLFKLLDENYCGIGYTTLINGDFNISDSYSGVMTFQTFLYQNMKEGDKKIVDDISDKLWQESVSVGVLLTLLYNDISGMIVEEYSGELQKIGNYYEMIKGRMDWLRRKINDLAICNDCDCDGFNPPIGYPIEENLYREFF